MFDLNREVKSWAASVYAQRCEASASIDELSDHLYCEIERGRAEGLSDEAAFHAAVARLGSATALAAEDARNRSALSTVCQVASKFERSTSMPQHRRALLAHAVIWASLMLAASIVMKTGGVSRGPSLLLLSIMVPLWSASDRLMQRVLRHRDESNRV